MYCNGQYEAPGMCDSLIECSTLYVENYDRPTKLGTEAQNPELKNARDYLCKCFCLNFVKNDI